MICRFNQSFERVGNMKKILGTVITVLICLLLQVLVTIQLSTHSHASTHKVGAYHKKPIYYYV